jgi:hypothetical protein
MHKIVVLDIETIPERNDCGKANVDPDAGFPPFPLHALACVSLLTISKPYLGATSFSLQSFDREELGERGIVACTEAALAGAQLVITYNGSGFDIPVLMVRAAITGERVPTLSRLHLPSSRVGMRHVDLAREIRSNGKAPPVKLVELCAAFQIPVKLDCAGSAVAKMAAQGEWGRIQRYCESDVVATWLAYCYWTGAADGVPEYGEQNWTALADWIAEDPARWPHLDSYMDVPSLGGGGPLGVVALEGSRL